MLHIMYGYKMYSYKTRCISYSLISMNGENWNTFYGPIVAFLPVILLVTSNCVNFSLMNGTPWRSNIRISREISFWGLFFTDFQELDLYDIPVVIVFLRNWRFYCTSYWGTVKIFLIPQQKWWDEPKDFWFKTYC